MPARSTSLTTQSTEGEPRARRAAAMPPAERRQAIVAATLPLLTERGLAVTTREIAEAAGIAEGTIFRVFADKDELIAACVEAALDTAALEARLAAIDPELRLEARLAQAVRALQERTTSVWQLVSNVGFASAPEVREHVRSRNLADLPPLVALFAADRATLRWSPRECARRLRALTLAASHPAFVGDQPLAPAEIVSLFLDGVRRRIPDVARPAVGRAIATDTKGRRRADDGVRARDDASEHDDGDARPC